MCNVQAVQIVELEARLEKVLHENEIDEREEMAHSIEILDDEDDPQPLALDFDLASRQKEVIEYYDEDVQIIKNDDDNDLSIVHSIEIQVDKNTVEEDWECTHCE